jgi:hypothetical protein
MGKRSNYKKPNIGASVDHSLTKAYEILLLANAFALVIVAVSLPSFLPLFLVGML